MPLIADELEALLDDLRVRELASHVGLDLDAPATREQLIERVRARLACHGFVCPPEGAASPLSLTGNVGVAEHGGSAPPVTHQAARAVAAYNTAASFC